MAINPWLQEQLKKANPPRNLGLIVEVDDPQRMEAVKSTLRAISGVSVRQQAFNMIRVSAPSEALLVIGAIPGVTVHYDAPVWIKGAPSFFDPLLGTVRLSQVTIPVTPMEMAARFPFTLPLTLLGLPFQAMGRDPLKIQNPNCIIVPTGETRKVLEPPEDNKMTQTRVAVLDSTPGYTPVLVKDSSGVDVLPLEDFWHKVQSPAVSLPSEEQFKAVEGWRVFTRHRGRGYWTRIKRIIRHLYQGEIIRVNTLAGVVDVTPNHSLFSSGGDVAEASKITVGDRIASPFANLRKRELRYAWPASAETLYVGDTEQAWLEGFFAAEGSAWRKKGSGGVVAISQKETPRLERAAAVITKTFHLPVSISRWNGMAKLTGQRQAVADWFARRFYTTDRRKRVPREILSAPEEIRLTFLRGYNDGDGYINPRLPWEFQNFTTDSQTLAAGLYYLLRVTTGQSISVHVREDKPDVVQLTINQHSKHQRGDAQAVKKIQRYWFHGYVYDLETEDNSFCAGVGFLKLHNTGIGFPHPLLHPSKGLIRMESTTGEPPLDGLGHGTHCLTTAFGDSFNTRFGECRGVADPENGTLMSVKCLSNIGFGSQFSVIAAMERAVNWGAKIISMSLGGPLEGGVDDDPQCRIIDRLKDEVIFVVAAGNDGPQEWTIGSPGASPHCVTVGAYSTYYKGLANFSSRGPSGEWYRDRPSIWTKDQSKYGADLTQPDLVAPGGGPVESGDTMDVIYSGVVGWTDGMNDLTPGDLFDAMRGTSMATPAAAGLIALAYDRGLVKTAADVKKKMARGESKDRFKGYGLLTWGRLQ
ncbi:MAG: S8 family serine peptidase [Chloroflexota bacterium]